MLEIFDLFLGTLPVSNNNQKKSADPAAPTELICDAIALKRT